MAEFAHQKHAPLFHEAFRRETKLGTQVWSAALSNAGKVALANRANGQASTQAQQHAKMRICFPTSSGGHLTQLLQLRPFWGEHERFWVTFDKEDANSKLAGERVYHCFYPTNRNIPNLVRNTGLAITVLRKERPDIIMSTGAAVAIPFFLVGKAIGAKTVYIEVIDRIDAPTLSGRICKPLSDVFVVQWPEMEKIYKGSVNLGSVF